MSGVMVGLSVYVSRYDLAELLSVSPRTINRMAAMGRLPRLLRFGVNTVRWRRSDVEEFLNNKHRAVAV